MDATWHGSVIVEADDATQASERVANDIACIPAKVDAINPVDETVDAVAELARSRDHYKTLAGEILSTVRVNLSRGTLTCGEDGEAKLSRKIDEWRERFATSPVENVKDMPSAGGNESKTEKGN